jgi:hypothetical protein
MQLGEPRKGTANSSGQVIFVAAVIAPTDGATPLTRATDRHKLKARPD